jgi:hypothetical protein
MKYKVVLSNQGEYELDNVLELMESEPTMIGFVPDSVAGVAVRVIAEPAPNVIPYELVEVGPSVLFIPEQYLRSYEELV